MEHNHPLTEHYVFGLSQFIITNVNFSSNFTIQVKYMGTNEICIVVAIALNTVAM